MTVYAYAPDLDLSKEGEGFIFGVKGIGGSDGIVYANKDSSCDRCIFFMIVIRGKCLLLRSESCVAGCHRGGVGGALG